MKRLIYVLVALLVVVLALSLAWEATRRFGPEMLRREMQLSATVELQRLEQAVRKENPRARSAEETFGAKLPIVSVALLLTPAPFVFEARSEVEILPRSGESKTARYVWTPWHVYELKVIERMPIVPPLSDPPAAFQSGRPNNAADRMPGTTAPRERNRH